MYGNAEKSVPIYWDEAKNIIDLLCINIDKIGKKYYFKTNKILVIERR